MPTKVHFINVGQGNMTLLELANNQKWIYDCNITNDNENDVFGYLDKHIKLYTAVDTFICSHRDADHMRGIKRLHKYFPIKHVFDTGVVGTTTNSTEYLEYMELRKAIGFTEVKSRTCYDYGNTRLRFMNSKNYNLPKNANAQSIVVKVVHRDAAADINKASVLLTGDTDAATWKEIHNHYTDDDLACDLLLASHHGSLTYFDDPSDTANYYLRHIKAKKPAMTIISVGNNAHGHPDTKALEFYNRYSLGSAKGEKVFRTDERGHMRVTLKDDGGWSLTPQK